MTIRKGGDDGIDWEAVKTTSPEEWSEALKAQIVAAGHDVEALAERIRQGRTEEHDASVPDLDAIGRRIRAAVAAGEITAEQGRERMQAARDRLIGEDGRKNGDARLQEFRRSVAERAMAIPPEEWSEGLKAAIVKAGWNLDEFTEGVRQRQAAVRESTDPDSKR